MGTLIKYLVDRMGEASTWRGVILIITAVGVKLSPEQATAIITAGIALAGVIGVFFKDKLGKEPGKVTSRKK